MHLFSRLFSRFSLSLIGIALIMAAGSPVSAEGEKILQVVVSGNRRIEPAVVLNAVKTKTGDLLIHEKVDADVRSVYKLGYFLNVTASSDRKDGGVVVTFNVEEKPSVREVKIEGTKELSLDKVKEAVEIKPNTIFTQKDLDKSVRKVKKLYADEGYYLAEVVADPEKRPDGDLNAVFKIKEGNKVLITDIVFEGNKAFSDRQLRKVIETKEKWFLSWLTGAGTLKEEVLKNDVNLLAEHYYNNGYVNVKVGEPLIALLPDKSGLKVTIGITEGDQFRTGNIAFKGELLTDSPQFSKGLTLKPGEVFSRASLRSDVFTITDHYADKGYAFANVAPVTKPNPSAKTIDLTYELEKGEKVSIDRINIGGNTKTRDKVIRREVKLAEGDYFSSTALKRSKQNLMNTGFFEDVAIATAAGSSENKLSLNIDVKEKPTGTFSIGAGYSSLDGFIGQGSVQQANFLGLGLKANAAASIGGKSQTYNLGLTDPYFMDTKWTLGGDLYRTQRDYINFTKRTTGGDIKAGYPISDDISTFWLYKYEKKDIFNITQSSRTDEDLRSGTVSSIYGSLTRNTTDYRLDPTRGMVNTLSVEFAGLGGTDRFVRYEGETSMFFPMPLSTVLSARGRLGYIQGIGMDVPQDEKYFLGGITSIRGYEGRTISPYIPNPDWKGYGKIQDKYDFYGGDKQAIFNLEYTFPLIKEAGLKGVLFFDAGNSYDVNETILTSFRMSYGGGIRWVSPIGPLRLEYGIPLNPRPGIDKKSGRFEFSIGSFF